jgi:fatty acid-binding protein DegV
MKAKDVPAALFNQLKTETKGKIEAKKKIIVAISHADNLEGAKKLKEIIERELKGATCAFLSLIDPVVGVHSGPDTLILSWAPN